MAEEDAQDVRRCLAGDEEACDRLVRRHAGGVRAVCLAQAGFAAVEDLVQDSFLKAWRSLGALRDPAAFGPWLRGIARHTAVDWVRSRARRRPLEAGPEPLATLAAPVRSVDLDDLIESLPVDLREVIVMKYFEGEDYTGMAARLGLSTAGVNARITRARRWLRENWQPEGGSPPTNSKTQESQCHET